MPSSLGQWRQFPKSTEHSWVYSVKKVVSTELTRASKESLLKKSVNQAHSVNKGEIEQS